jgi:hypothetical protein
MADAKIDQDALDLRVLAIEGGSSGAGAEVEGGESESVLMLDSGAKAELEDVVTAGESGDADPSEIETVAGATIGSVSPQIVCIQLFG